MLKFIVGVIFGGVIMAGILIPITIDQRKEKLASGFKQGHTEGEMFIIDFLSKYFKPPSPSNENNFIDEISCKTRAIFIVKENGEITLKVR